MKLITEGMTNEQVRMYNERRPKFRGLDIQNIDFKRKVIGAVGQD